MNTITQMTIASDNHKAEVGIDESGYTLLKMTVSPQGDEYIVETITGLLWEHAHKIALDWVSWLAETKRN